MILLFLNAASKSYLNIASPDLLYFTFAKHSEFYWITQFSEMSKFWAVNNSECCSRNKLSLKKVQTPFREVHNSSIKKQIAAKFRSIIFSYQLWKQVLLEKRASENQNKSKNKKPLSLVLCVCGSLWFFDFFCCCCFCLFALFVISPAFCTPEERKTIYSKSRGFRENIYLHIWQLRVYMSEAISTKILVSL